MPAAQTIGEEAGFAVAGAEHARENAEAAEATARQAWEDARPDDVTEEAWAARWETFAANAIEAAAEAEASHEAAENSLSHVGDDDDDADDADDDDDDEDADDGDDDEEVEYGWDGSPIKSEEEWEDWSMIASELNDVARKWENVEEEWDALTARLQGKDIDKDDD